MKWRAKRAHDHLRQVLTRRPTRALAETLREVAKQMSFHISVSTGPVPEDIPDGPAWSRPEEEQAPPLVSLAEAQTEIPAFRLPASMVQAPHTVRVLRNRDGSPRGVQYDANAGATEGGFTVSYFRIRSGVTGIHFSSPFAKSVVFDEPTQVAGHQGRWWQVDADQTVSWRSVRGLWQVHSRLPATDLRRIAEEIAALQPPETEPASDQPPVPPPPVSAGEARAALPGFTLAPGFVEHHAAQVCLLHRSGEQEPDGVQVHAAGFVVWYLPPGAQPIRIPGLEITGEHRPVAGREAVWWKSPDRRAVSWPAEDGGRWRVGGRLEEGDLRRIAEEVALATR